MSWWMSTEDDKDVVPMNGRGSLHRNLIRTVAFVLDTP